MTMEISKKIMKRRKELNLTLQDIADKVGVSRQTIFQWETGAIKEIGISKINSLARALRVDPISLIVDDRELVEKEYQEPIPTLNPFDKQLLDLVLQLTPNEKIELYNQLVSKVSKL